MRNSGAKPSQDLTKNRGFKTSAAFWLALISAAANA